MADLNVPEDIVVQILSWLPVKSLLRFRSVCKCWRYQISKSRFVKLHMDHTRMNSNNNFFIAHSFQSPRIRHPNLHPNQYIYCSHHHHKLFLIDTNFLNNTVNLELPFPTSTHPDGFVVVGSCNGLLCLADESIYIWNPATRQLKNILNYPSKEKYSFCDVSFGFGFDHASNDYKVLKIVAFLPRGYSASQVDVYSLNEGSWKVIKVELGFRIIHPVCTAIVKGRPYWLAENISVPWRSVVISFDLHTEVFCSIPLPDSILDLDHGFDFGLLEFKESLAIFVVDKYQDISIWTVDDDCCGKTCWSKKLTFMNNPIIKMLVGGLKTGQFVAQTFLNELILYDPVKQEVKHTQLQKRSFKAFSYSESLVNLISNAGVAE